jgi:hypothetical protein
MGASSLRVACLPAGLVRSNLAVTLAGTPFGLLSLANLVEVKLGYAHLRQIDIVDNNASNFLSQR